MNKKNIINGFDETFNININNKYIYISILALTFINYFIKFENINIFVIFLICIAINILLINKMNYKNKIIIILFFISFISKAIYSLFLLKNNIFPFEDSLTYLHHLDIMKDGFGIVSFKYVYNIAQSLHVGYHYFIYCIDFIFRNNYALYMANVIMFQASSVLFLNYMEMMRFKRKIINIVILFSLISFNMMIFTSNILKDSLVLFATMITICSYGAYKKGIYKSKNNIIIIIILGLMILLFTRIYTCIAIMMGIMADYIVADRNLVKLIKNRKINKKNIIILLFTLVALYVLIKNTSIWMYVYAIANSLKDALSNIPMLVIGTIKELIRTFISPLPWNAIDNFDVYTVTAIDSTIAIVFGFALIMFVIKFIKFKEFRKISYIYIVPIIVQASILGITYDSGSVRQRISIFLFMPLMYCIGFYYKENDKDKGIYKL